MYASFAKSVADKCGQATLDDMYASYAKSVAGLQEGTCVAQGFTTPAGE